jgi:fatty acid desaturase
MTHTNPLSTTEATLPADGGPKIATLFTGDELRALTARSNWMGLWAVGSTWAITAAGFAVLAWASTQSPVLAVPAAAVGLGVIAGRQLCLGILMHDAAHGTLFKSKWFNHTFADWTCARPIWNDLPKYRRHHFAHHAKAGTPEDTDVSLVTPYPCSRASLARKFLRDLSGVTGIKFITGRLLMDAGYVKWTVANDAVPLPKDGVTLYARFAMLVRNAAPTVLMNALLFAALLWTGHPWLYAAWILAYMVPFSLFVRVRSLAEHACTARTTDIFQNTRSSRAGWLARSTVAPLRVNYHIEHHLLMSVPYFRLPALHQMLRDRGALPEPPGYWAVLRQVSSPEVR